MLEEREEERRWGRRAFLFFFSTHNPPQGQICSLSEESCLSFVCVDVFSQEGEIVRKVASPQR